MRQRKKQDGKREPNGRLSRKPADVMARTLAQVDRDVRETLMVGLEARVRVYGVKSENSRDQMAGSFVGRLCMDREISRAQYEAAMTWMEDASNYSIAIRSPRMPGAIDLNRTRGINDYENVDRVKRWTAKYKAACKAVQEKQIELRGRANLMGALDTCVMRDVALYHLVGDLRYALNALVKHYRIEGGRLAA